LTEFILFGGTTEGRESAALLAGSGHETLVCVASAYGEAMLEPQAHLTVQARPLDEEAMASLLRQHRPRLVMDATHPYADGVSASLRRACGREGMPYLRIVRPAMPEDGCLYFDDLPGLVSYLNNSRDLIFSTLGGKEASALSAVEQAAERIFLRVLPRVESLNACLDACFLPAHIICMQGPFSKELNRAMFAETKAQILVTKETGAAGGFPEKVEAARELDMRVAVLRRPPDTDGITVTELANRLKEGSL